MEPYCYYDRLSISKTQKDIASRKQTIRHIVYESQKKNTHNNLLRCISKLFIYNLEQIISRGVNDKPANLLFIFDNKNFFAVLAISKSVNKTLNNEKCVRRNVLGIESYN